MPSKYLTLNLLFLILLQPSCKTNQTVNKEREGKWIYKDTVNEICYKTVGRYKKGTEQKTWRYFANKKIIKKEKYKNDICSVTTYFNNGKIASVGQTKMTITESKSHWFYFGDWLFYDDNGNLISTKTYENGEMIKEVP